MRQDCVDLWYEYPVTSHNFETNFVQNFDLSSKENRNWGPCNSFPKTYFY